MGNCHYSGFTKILSALILLFNTAVYAGIEGSSHYIHHPSSDHSGFGSEKKLNPTRIPGDGYAITVNAGLDTVLPLSQLGAVTQLTLKGKATGIITLWTWTKLSGGNVNIITPNAQNTNVTGFTAGNYSFLLTVTDGLNIATDIVNVKVVDYQKKGESPCRAGAPVTWNLTPSASNSIFYPYLRRDGFDIRGGDTIKIPRNPSNGGIYTGISLGDFGGSAGCPVVVVPTDLVTISGPAAYFRMGSGIGDSNFVSHVIVDGTYLRSKGIQYGFQFVNAAPSPATIGFTANLVTDLEAKGFYLQNTGVGVMTKLDSDSSHPWRIMNNFVLKNIKYHDIYIRRTTGEAMYLGHTSPQGDASVQAGNDGPTNRIDSIEVYNMLIDSSGWDGIQVSNAIYASIHDNIVIRAGSSNVGSQRAWIIMGGNTTGKIYNNVGYNLKEGIRGTPYGNVEIYNNYGDSIYVGTTSDGVYVTAIPTGPGTNVLEPRPPMKLSAHDNIFNRVERYAINNPNSYGYETAGEISYNSLVDPTRTLNQLIGSGAGDYIHDNKIYASFPVNMVSIGSNSTGVSIRVKQVDSTRTFNNAAAIIAWLKCRLSGSCSTIKKKPTANAGSDQTISLPVSIDTLKGTGTADGSIFYLWTKIAGPTTFSLVNANTAQAISKNLVQGVYSFELTVTDDAGQVAKDTMTVTVNSLVNQPPIANAGANQTIGLPTNSITLDGSASQDPNGAISTYSWSKVSGPAAGTIASPNSVTSSVTGLTQGIYIFKLIVTDNSGATNADSITVTVNASVNQPPFANAGANQTITLPINSVTVDGTASQDPDGTISSYTWTKISGPAAGTIANPAAAATVINGLTQGTYTFKLTVTDNKGAVDADSVTITVNAAANQSPVANAGSSQTITLPVNSVSLNGSASSDPDGNIVSYDWAQISGPTSALLTNANTATPTAGNLSAGQYTFELTVTDNSGATAKAQVKVTVVPVANLLPIANAGANQTITLPTNSVTLDGSASQAPSGTITTYSWSMVSGPASGSIATPGAVTASITGLTQGTYIFNLTVTDNNGVNASDQVTVVVNAAANQPPVANAGPSQTITLPANSANLNGSGSSDPDGSISSYSWAQVAGPSTAILTNGATATPSVTNLLAGQYSFELTVSDNNGATAKAQVKITVRTAADLPPIANAGFSKTIILPVNSVLLDGSASSDPDGSIASYSWAQVSGPTSAGLSNAGTATPTVSNMQIGQYVFELTVTDNLGATGKAQVKITVVAVANQPPIANAGSNQTIAAPVNTVTLDGTKSFDADGSIVQYNWVKISGPGTVNIVGAGASTPSVTGLQTGQYVFQLTVTDDKGATGTDQVTVTVEGPGNTGAGLPPVANAGNDTTIAIPTNTAVLNGSGSTDPDGTISVYQWTQVSGPGTAAILSPDAMASTVSNLVTGEYVFQLTVKDNNGIASTATVKIKVVDNLRSTDQFILYPNPAKDIVNLRLINDSLGTLKINIFDMTGKQVLISEMSKQQNYFDQSLNISGLARGMYTVQVFIGTNKRIVAKLIKQ